MLWVGTPVISTADETSGSEAHPADEASGDEEGDPEGRQRLVDALTKEFKGQRWDADKSAWK